VQLEQDLATVPTTPVRLHPSLAQVYRHQVERLQDALNEPEIRDEALQILRGLVERVSISPAENGLEVEIVGEIAKMVELGIENNAKRATLDETMTRSVKVVAGTRNRLDLQLQELLKTAIPWETTLRTSACVPKADVP
jgi:site-specific DNA recombinase